MTHNPVIKQIKLGILSQFDIGRTQQGVIKQGMHFRRLRSGEKLSRMELMQLRNNLLYIVDCRYHTWTWEVRLSSADDERPFKYLIESTYRIDNPEPVIQQNVIDIERWLQQKLLPDLRRVAGAARLIDYKQIGKRLKDIVQTHDSFFELGLELDGDVQITASLSDSDKQFIEELEQLINARTIPRQAKCTGELPTKQAMYKFEVEVNLQYLLLDPQQIRSLKDLETAVDLLWKTQIHKAIRQESRKFTYKETGAADAAIDQVLDQGNFEGYGIHVVSAAANLHLDKAGKGAAEEDELRARRFETDEQEQEHVRRTMLRDRMALLASQYAKGEITLQELLAYLDEKEMEAAGIPINTIRDLKDLDVLDPDAAQDAARAILTSTLAAAATKQVPSEANDLLLTMLERAKLPQTRNQPSTNSDEDDEDNENDEDIVG